jgi:hypothetical protein
VTGKIVRPSGLTALAVLNFIFGGFQSIGVLFALLSTACTVTVNGVARAPSSGGGMLSIGLNLAGAAALFVAGAGFLNVDRRAGRWAANAYVACAVAGILVRFLLPGAAGSSGVFSVISLIYPLLLVLYTNIVFRDLWRLPRKSARDRTTSGETGSGRRIPHVLLIANASIRQALRGASGVLFILSVWAAGLLAAQILFWPVTLLQAQARPGTVLSAREVLEQLNTFLLPLLSRLLAAAPGHASETWAEYLLVGRPGFLSLLFLVYSFLTPVIVAFVGSSQIASDTRNKGLRFLLLRTTRRDIFFGKLLGSAAVAAMALLALILAAIAHLQLRIAVYSLGPVIVWGLWGAAAFAILAFPYVSLSLAFSGIIDSGAGAFFSCMGAMVGIPVLGLALARLWQPLGAIAYVMPYRVALLLFSKSPGIVALSALALAGYAAAYAALGYFLFRRRDL